MTVWPREGFKGVAMSDSEYICDEDVIQDYYVYLHKDKATGVPFYVGKGKGRRARQTKSRGAPWEKKVESLPAGYEIEIVENTLTEEEAHDLEIHLIWKHKRVDEGGTLVNITPGGQGLVALFTFSVGSDDEYDNARFRQITVEQKHELAAEVAEWIKNLATRIGTIARDEDDESDLLNELDCSADSILDSAKGVARRKVRYKSFCWTLTEALETVEWELEDPDGDPHPDTVALANEFLSRLRSWLAVVSVPGSPAESQALPGDKP